MNRHAYIILAHNEPQILATLVRMIDDSRNDIFIHVDAKADMKLFADIAATRAQLYWTPRVKVYWGGPSQIRAERTAIACARAHGPYARYHLISGVDLPVKSQDYIHDFCDNRYPDREFIGFDPHAADNAELRAQWSHYLLLDDFVRCPNPLVRKGCSFLRKAFVRLQCMVRFERHPDFEIKKGSNWASFTQNFADWLMGEKGDAIYRFFQHAHCSDEKWLQTAVWNSPYRDKIFDLEDEMRGCMRAIDWERGTPYVWQKDDLEELLSSDRLFARKFSSEHADVVQALYERLRV